MWNNMMRYATYETENICSSMTIKLDCMFGVNEKPLTVISESRNTFFLLHLKRFSLRACSVKNLRLKKSNKHRRQILYNVYIHDDDAMERKNHLLMCTQFSIYYPLNREQEEIFRTRIVQIHDGYEGKEKQELHTDTKIIGSRFIFLLP